MQVPQVVAVFFGAVYFECVCAGVPFFYECAGLPVEICDFIGGVDD